MPHADLICTEHEEKNTHPDGAGCEKTLVGVEQQQAALVLVQDGKVIVAEQNTEALLRHPGAQLGQAMVT